MSITEHGTIPPWTRTACWDCGKDYLASRSAPASPPFRCDECEVWTRADREHQAEIDRQRYRAFCLAWGAIGWAHAFRGAVEVAGEAVRRMPEGPAVCAACGAVEVGATMGDDGVLRCKGCGA